MKDELKEGEYIRTKDGIITKIINPKPYIKEYIETDRGFIFKGNIVKYNSNILDVIEDEDFVILEYKSPKYRKRIKRKFEVSKFDEFIRFENAHCSFLCKEEDKEITDDMCKNIKILSILTHEQLRNIEYTI